LVDVPHGAGAHLPVLMLCAACLRHIAGTQWGTKRYLRMELLNDLGLPETVSA
jgi:hypothetical protein